MEINADFAERVVVHSAEQPWLTSPMKGVERRPLDRIGDEVARATSIVRYDPGSRFSAHTHHGGEEFIVLDGVFQDEHGDYPVGSYVRNPPRTAHTPGSVPGCVLFVKLWQFDADDAHPVRIDMSSEAGEVDADRPDVTVVPLHRDEREVVRLERWDAGTTGALVAEGGAEILVLSGSIAEGGDTLQRHSWLRLPDGAMASLEAGPEGADIWVKTGHLRHIRVPPVTA